MNNVSLQFAGFFIAYLGFQALKSFDITVMSKTKERSLHANAKVNFCHIVIHDLQQVVEPSGKSG